jgi:hypothetical protein
MIAKGFDDGDREHYARKRVPSRPTSCMIRVITGILVTATAIPNTSTSAALLFAGR